MLRYIGWFHAISFSRYSPLHLIVQQRCRLGESTIAAPYIREAWLEELPVVDRIGYRKPFERRHEYIESRLRINAGSTGREATTVTHPGTINRNPIIQIWNLSASKLHQQRLLYYAQRGEIRVEYNS